MIFSSARVLNGLPANDREQESCHVKKGSAGARESASFLNFPLISCLTREKEVHFVLRDKTGTG